jgi:hypothetical protein
MKANTRRHFNDVMNDARLDELIAICSASQTSTRDHKAFVELIRTANK